MTVAALSTAVTAAMVAQTKIDVIANNVANINTTAFKGSNVETADLFYMTLKKAGTIENADATRRPVGVQVGLGSKVTGTNRNLAIGPISQTSQPLDIAITSAAGYLAITLPNGRIGYTRAGNLKRDPDNGLIVTNDGNPLTNNITIPANINTEDINIARDGRITAQDPANSANEIEIGQLEIFTFPNERGLQGIGENAFEATLASGDAIQIDDTNNRFQQGFLEGSNVSQVKELSELINANRDFEVASRVMHVADEMMKDANAIK